MADLLSLPGPTRSFHLLDPRKKERLREFYAQGCVDVFYSSIFVYPDNRRNSLGFEATSTLDLPVSFGTHRFLATTGLDFPVSSVIEALTKGIRA